MGDTTYIGGYEDMPTPIATRFIQNVIAAYSEDEQSERDVLPMDVREKIIALEYRSQSLDLIGDHATTVEHFSPIIDPGQWQHHAGVGSFAVLHQANKGEKPNFNTTFVHVRESDVPPIHVHKGGERSRQPAEVTATLRGGLAKFRDRGIRIVAPNTIPHDGKNTIDVYLPQSFLKAFDAVFPGILETMGVRKTDIGKGWVGLYHQPGGSSVNLREDQPQRAMKLLEEADKHLRVFAIDTTQFVLEQRRKLLGTE